jgi:hypothetical protein
MVAPPGDGTQGEQPGQRSATFRPDRLTQLEGSLDYYEAFNPSIAPFKRVTALDATALAEDGRTPVLGIHDARRMKVKVEGADSVAPDPRARDRFWGAVTLDFAKGRVLPLPSVSPESRILSVRTEPPIQLVIERDGADNFFAVARGAVPKQAVFLAFLTDAPRSYFGTELPHAPLATLAAHVPPLDRRIRARALAFAKELGIGPRADFASALETLTAHFRSFEEASVPPKDSGDIYLDLARAKKGICRHRAYAFVVTAQALGIPARFIQNEAHSWVEVELPRIGFMRIDLGGSAHGLTAHGANDRPAYQPAQPDPLPRPLAYAQSYSLLGHNVTGMRKPQLSELTGRWISPAKAEAGGGARSSEAGAFLGGTDRGAAPAASGRAQLIVSLGSRYSSVLRGETLPVSGRVRDSAGHGIAGLRIEVSLAAEGRRERLLLGITVTDARGMFAASFGVPPDLDTGDYRLVVVTPGNQAYLPAMAE